MRVNCGVCPSCLVDKSKRLRSLITYHSYYDDTVALFVTLTYRNSCIPYVFVDDIRTKPVIQVYRDCKTYRYAVKHKDCSVVKKERFVYGLCELDEFYNNQYVSPFQYTTEHCKEEFSHSSRLIERGFNAGEQSYFRYKVSRTDYSKLPFLGVKSLNGFNGVKDRVGVLYNADIVNFFKRLKQNLKRVYNKELNLGYWYCSEYGPTTFRPHFHLLVWCPRNDVEVFTEAIVESWPFGSRQRTRKYIEIARDCSRYVSSYVNGFSNLPPFLQQKSFRPKTNHTHFFGFNFRDFLPSNFYQKALQGNISYSTMVYENGIPVRRNFLYPKYLFSRYVPKCKGFSKLTSDEVYRIYSGLEPVKKYSYKLGFRDGLFDVKHTNVFEFSETDFLHKRPKLYYCKYEKKYLSETQYFQRLIDRSRYAFLVACPTYNALDFGLLVSKIYTLRASELYKRQFYNLLPNQIYYVYDNLNQLYSNPSLSPTLVLNETIVLNPNKYPTRLLDTHVNEYCHERWIKRAKVTDFVINQLNY